jgi:hypothetical protein
MKTDYDKKCRECSTFFVPYKSTDKYCYLCSKTKLALKNLEKIKKEKVKKQKEDLLTLQDYLKLAQQVFNKWINLRDKGLPCISCDKPINGRVNASHFYNANNHHNLRFDEDNVHSSCINCNQFLSGNLLEYRTRLCSKIGQERFNKLEEKRHVTKKWSKDELELLIKKYKQKTKELEK